MVHSANKEAEEYASENDAKSSFKLDKCLSIYLKIYMNYIHMISIISGMDFRWPYYIENYFSVQNNVGSVSSQVISIECLIIGKIVIILTISIIKKR